MIKKVIVCCATLFLYGCADGVSSNSKSKVLGLAATKKEQKSEYIRPLPEGPTEYLIFSAMPPVTDARTRKGIINYGIAARAWWVEERCHFAETELRQEFEQKLAIFTKLLNALLASEFEISSVEASKHTQTVQMYALNEMSAKHFYGCGKEASRVFLRGVSITQGVTRGIKVVQ